MKKKTSRQIVPLEMIEERIFVIHGVKVILDSDLAELYGVSTKRLNEQVRRNRTKFPEDFMFQLTQRETQELSRSRSREAASEEGIDLRSQNATSSGYGGRRYLPYAFTEYGALQAANVVNSPKATAMSLYIIRAFVRMREIFVVNQILETRLTEIEKFLLSHDGELKDLHEKIKRLLVPPKTDAIGFKLTSLRPGKIG
ncbi:MAG: ORF6N domain-containing protein [Candidatus Omnitrophica bacterium]|nr:ORF6N domain-containing protein [Candidatus Omnitrophota bacterium]